ncbi:MAG: LptF/LptG family permease [Pirellulales bacterium]|nr:LptF/LptG family permease [Pirellulales bacterium]
MLPILDRYVMVHYLQSFIVCFVSLAGLYIVIDALTHLDQFMAHAGEQGGLLAVLSKYYGYRSVAFFDRMSAIFALAAAIFTVLWLQRHNELTAILAAGIPKLRILKPILIASLVVAILAAINRESILPRLRGELLRGVNDLSDSNQHALYPCIDAQTGILLGGEGTFVAKRAIDRPRFVLPPNLAERGTQIVADQAIYQPSKAGRPAGYLLIGVSEPNGLTALPSIHHRDQPIVLTPHDTPWLKEGQAFVASGVSYEHLAAGGTWQDYASITELIRHARSPSIDVAADVLIAVHARFLRPFLDMTLLFVGLPIVLARGGRNVYLSVGLCLGVIAAFLGIMVVCQFLGASHWTSPALAAWLPLILFGPAAVALRGSLIS